MQGFLLLDKPSGISSFGAVAAIRRLTGEKRIGHTGTLDPMATGVLPILIGKSTALSSHLLESDKTYIATVKLGIATDTDDITGKIISRCSVNVSNDNIISALMKFKGKIKQTPPIYSALKQDGVRLYQLARQGKTAEIPQRDVEIFDISLLSPINCENEFSFQATVSKGTYIRSLARDIGEFLGCYATLCALRRTRLSGFGIENCVELGKLSAENIKDYISDETDALPHLSSVEVSPKQAVLFSNGGQLFLDRLPKPALSDGQTVKVCSGGTFLGIGIADTKNNLLNIGCNINKP